MLRIDHQGAGAEQKSLEQIQAFLNASQEIRFEGETQPQIYHWIEQVLGRQEYHQQSRPARGLLRSYLTKMTGLSRAQVTRLSLIHISEPTRLGMISYAVFCLKKKKPKIQ